MKKSVLLLMVLLMAAKILKAQTPVLLNKGDKIAFDSQVKYGDVLTFKLCNVNPFYYNVVINATTETYDFGDAGKLLSDNLKGITQELTGGQALVAPNGNKNGNKEVFGTRPILNIDDFINNFDLVIGEVCKLDKLDELDTALRALVMTDQPLDYGNMEYIKNQIVAGILGDDLDRVDYFAVLNNYFSGTYVRLEKYLTDLSVEYKLLSDSEKKLVSDKKSYIDELVKELNKKKFEEKFASVRKLYNDIREDAFCVTKTIPVQRKADEIKIAYIIKEKYDKTPAIIERDSLTVLVKKKFNINVSTGGVLTWLNDYKYTTANVKTEDGTVQQIALKNSGKVEFATGVLAHVYANCKPNFSPALSFGFAVNGDNELRYLAGGSLIFGRKQRIVVSGGVAAGKTDRLAENQQIGQKVESMEEVQLVSSIKAKGFVSFTYNF
jgi:hypothetical protein